MKSLVTLGVNNIYIFDNQRVRTDEFFLDIPLQNGASKADSIDQLVRKCFKSDCNIVKFHATPSNALLSRLKLDAIIDCTNREYSHGPSWEYAESRGIALFTVCADVEKGELAFYERTFKNKCNPLIKGYTGNYQGKIISNLLCAITVEEFRKYIFKKHKNEFTIPILRENTSPTPQEAAQNIWFKEFDYKTLIEREPMLISNFYHDLNGATIKERTGKERSQRIKSRYELNLTNPQILVLGGGALANYCALMLCQLPNGRVDFVDFDRYADHNIARQHLAYDKINYLKAEVLSEKIRKINRSLKSEGIIGFAGEQMDAKVAEQFKGQKIHPILVNEAWIRNRGYQIIFGCFDNMKARAYAAQTAFNLKIPYIDSGSGAEPTKGTMYVYLPSRDQESISKIFDSRRVSTDVRNERWAAFSHTSTGLQMEQRNYFIQGQSCAQFVAGSVSMGNQAAAALQVSEARRILNPNEYGAEVVKNAGYRSDISYLLGLE